MDFWTKIARWAYVQTVGSKGKALFDAVIGPEINVLVANGVKDPSTILNTLVDSPAVTEAIANILNTLKIPSFMAGFVQSQIDQWLKDAILAGLNKAHK